MGTVSRRRSRSVATVSSRALLHDSNYVVVLLIREKREIIMISEKVVIPKILPGCRVDGTAEDVVGR